MNHSYKGPQFSLEEAVETLTDISEMNIERGVAVAPTDYEALAAEETLSQQLMQLIYQEKFEEAIGLIKETFRVILHHLHQYNKQDYSRDNSTIDNINAIMVLVGETAKKLDKYALLIHHEKELCVTKLKEYKRLHEFYHKRIAHKIDNSLLSKWIMGLSTRVFQQTIPPPYIQESTFTITPSQHIFVDLDAVKNDSEYELFFIRKEDGTRFYSPRLIRNIKLICDFGKSIIEERSDDPLISLPLWRDLCFQASAKELILHTTPAHEAYSLIHHDPHSELSSCLSKAAMALLLCSQTHNRWHDPAIKSCLDYFADFQKFLRLALSTKEHNQLLAYPTQMSQEDQITLTFIQELCKGLFLHLNGFNEFVKPLANLIHDAYESTGKLHKMNDLYWKRLLDDYHALTKFIKPHATGPMANVLELLENGNRSAFDSIFQGNLPAHLFSISTHHSMINNIYMPAPVRQESIDKAIVVEEFKQYLRSLQGDENHLLINLQDRLSWKESARAIALEELQGHGDFAEKLTVVSIPKDTEFYHQLSPYNHENHADKFLDHLKRVIKNNEEGFYLTEEVQEACSTKFLDDLIGGIHKIFFANRNVLPKERRLDFIEIFYMFLQLKIIDIISPTAFSLICKDGIDTSAAANAQLYYFIKLLNGQKMTVADEQKMSQIIHGPAIFLRERVMLLDKFQRMNSTIKEIEMHAKEKGEADFAKILKETFTPLYSKDFLGF